VISNSGVAITENEIHIPLTNGSKVLIDLVVVSQSFLTIG